MNSNRPLVLLAFHWYLEALHEGAQRRLMEAGYDTALLTSDTLEQYRGKPVAGIVGMLPDPGHPVRGFTDAFEGPLVELSLAYPEFTRWGRVPDDCAKVAEMAASRLRRLPARSFLFVAGNHRWNHDARWAVFSRELEGDARPCERCLTGGMDSASASRLAEHLLRMPKPVAVFGSTDEWARLALDAADLAGLRVPGDVYILGFANRELVSRVAPVPLSTIEIDHAAWARSAAGLLVDMMAGREKPGVVRPFPPGQLIERESTAGETGGDPLCERALALMREKVATPPSVPELARALGVSQATLERAFLTHLGTGVAKRFLDLRIEEAKARLSAGEKIEYVAAQVGFDSLRGFTYAFRRLEGESPGTYSERCRRPAR